MSAFSGTGRHGLGSCQKAFHFSNEENLIFKRNPGLVVSIYPISFRMTIKIFWSYTYHRLGRKKRNKYCQQQETQKKIRD